MHLYFSSPVASSRRTASALDGWIAHQPDPKPSREAKAGCARINARPARHCLAVNISTHIRAAGLEGERKGNATRPSRLAVTFVFLFGIMVGPLSCPREDEPSLS